MRLSGIVLDSPDPRALAAFYRSLTGYETQWDEPEWVKLLPPGGGAGLSFQLEPSYVAPVWPSTDANPQMQIHLDFEVTDLPGEVARAVSLGATLAEWQPQEDVRVLLDPVGHPFCLFLPGA